MRVRRPVSATASDPELGLGSALQVFRAQNDLLGGHMTTLFGLYAKCFQFSAFGIRSRNW